MQDLKDKVAVVTGAASGIGAGICRAFARERTRIVVADIDLPGAENVARELRDTGADAIALPVDVTSGVSVAAFADAVHQRYGSVNVLCNNAGVGVQGDLHKHSEADWDWVMSVNLKSIFYTVRAFVPRMLETGVPAHIQNTASEHGVGLPVLGRSPAYTASKHAVVGLSDVMRRDYGQKGIEVSVLCPGLVRTRIYDSARSRPADRFGEGLRIPPDQGEPFMELGLDADIAGQIAVDGIKAGDFFIITHPHIREFADTRHEQVSAGCDKADARGIEVSDGVPRT
jgi:NAD(P)-dependent dehydrogenase (short-subunit alcohol dehydrogenase family)